MSKYIIKLGTALAETLERGAAAQPAQFCGYWANHQFWLSELGHLHSLVHGHDDRFRQMKEAHARYLQKTGEPHNLDDLDEPFQTVTATTRRGERLRIFGRARTAFERMADRALDLNLLDLETHDQITERLKFEGPQEAV